LTIYFFCIAGDVGGCGVELLAVRGEPAGPPLYLRGQKADGDQWRPRGQHPIGSFSLPMLKLFGTLVNNMSYLGKYAL
jgi:hypothetical protein